MRYNHNREQSKEFLRQAVTLMGRQQASFDPASFTLWYEHVAGLNPGLSQILDERLKSQNPLTDADVSQLYTRFIASGQMEAIERIQARLLTHLAQTCQELSDTGVHASEFSERLESHKQVLQRPAAANAIEATVTELMTETQQMILVSRTMARQLDTRASDVQSLTQRLQQAEAEALIDPLTGLFNRRGLEQAVHNAVGQTGLLKNTALLLVDLDEFKGINDSHGHPVGDRVLSGVAQLLRARVKGADVVARIGGDEFAILLPETTIQGAMAVAEQIRKAVGLTQLRRAQQDQVLGKVSVSIGVTHTQPERALESLLSEADAALYEAKRGGRNQVRMTAARDTIN